MTSLPSPASHSSSPMPTAAGEAAASRLDEASLEAFDGLLDALTGALAGIGLAVVVLLPWFGLGDRTYAFIAPAFALFTWHRLLRARRDAAALGPVLARVPAGRRPGLRLAGVLAVHLLAAAAIAALPLLFGRPWSAVPAALPYGFATWLVSGSLLQGIRSIEVRTLGVAHADWAAGWDGIDGLAWQGRGGRTLALTLSEVAGRRSIRRLTVSDGAKAALERLLVARLPARVFHSGAWSPKRGPESPET